MHNILSKIWLWARYAVVILLVLLAVYVTLGRIFFPSVAAFKDDIATELGLRLGAVVMIETAEGSWHGFDPVIKLHNVRVISPAGDQPAGGKLLEISMLIVQPDVLRSLINGSWEMQRIIVGDVNINLQQTGGGFGTWQRIHQLIAGSVGQTGGLDWAQLTSLLSTPTIQFEKLQLHWQEDERTLLHLAIPSMVLRVTGADLAISGTIHQPDAEQPLGQFTVFGDHGWQESFDGTIYFNWRNPDFFTPVIDWLSQQGTVLNVDSSEGELWLTIAANKFTEALAKLQPISFEWQQGQMCIIPVEKLGGTFALQQNLAGWTVAGSDLLLNWAGEALGPQQLLVHSRAPGEDTSMPVWEDKQDAGADDTQPEKQSETAYVAVFDSVKVNQLRRLLLASHILPETIAKPLQGYSPGGSLNNVRLSWRPASKDFTLAARLDDVSVQAYQGAPEIAALDGYLFLNQHQGWVDFSSAQLTLGFPALYHQSWTFEQASGRVDWRISPTAINISGEQLLAVNPSGKQGKFRGDFAISIPANADPAADPNIPASEPPGYFDLSLFVEDADATLAKELVPGHLLQDAVYAWLQAAFTEGQVSQGAYLFSGEIGSQAGAGQLQSMLVLDVNDLSLQFHPDWPQLNNLHGELEMRNNRLDGRIKSASIGGTVINSAAVQLTNLQAGAPLLDVKATAKPKSKDWQYWLHESPVAAYAKEAAGDWKISGRSDVGFRLLSDFSSAVPFVRVDTRARNLKFNSVALGLDISDVAGLVSFDNKKGFTGTELSGLFLGQRMQGQLTTSRWTDTEQALQLQVNSRISADKLAQLANTELELPVEGDFNYGLELNIAAGLATELEYIISSDLAGLAIQLPPPYQKKKQEARELKISRFWSFDNQQGRWNLDVKGWFDVNLLDAKGFTLGEVDTGLVRFGHQGKYKLPESGIEFVGVIPELDLTQWQTVIANINSAAVSEAGSAAAGGNEPAAASGSLLPEWLSGFEVDVERLTVGNELFRNAAITGRRMDRENMVIGVRDDGRIEGKIYVPLRGQSNIRLDLSRFYLNPAATEQAQSELLPEDIPLVDVAIEDFRIGERILGSWSWQAEERNSGIVFNNVEARFPGATYTGRLSWLYDEDIDVHTSILTGGFKGKRFEDFSRIWTERSPLNSETFEISTGIVWGRRPTEFAWEHVTGKLSFKMFNGTLNDTSAAADVFRVFGVLNTDALVRRLRLDFSDLYVEGLAYDEIEGNARIQEGLVRFETPLAVQGPSSAFKITGTTSLVDDSLDMDMVVVLPLTKNLPLASLLIGAPQIGGAVFLIDRLLGEPLSTLTSATYHISGTIQNPEIKLAQVFEKKNNSLSGKRRWEDQN